MERLDPALCECKCSMLCYFTGAALLIFGVAFAALG